MSLFSAPPSSTTPEFAPRSFAQPPQPAPFTPPAGATALRQRLTSDDRALMNAVAAESLRYGKAEEALAILQMVNRIWPEEPQTLRLLTQCFVALEDWAAAEATFEALERVQGEPALETGDRLRRAVILLKRYGLSGALSAFERFTSSLAKRLGS